MHQSSSRLTRPLGDNELQTQLSYGFRETQVTKHVTAYSGIMRDVEERCKDKKKEEAIRRCVIYWNIIPPRLAKNFSSVKRNRNYLPEPRTVKKSVKYTALCTGRQTWSRCTVYLPWRHAAAASRHVNWVIPCNSTQLGTWLTTNPRYVQRGIWHRHNGRRRLKHRS